MKSIIIFSVPIMNEYLEINTVNRKINAQKEIADTKLQIAKENKNKYDSQKPKDKK